MKEITLVVPDKIYHSLGSSYSSKTKLIDVTAKSIVKALTVCEYHENYYFTEDSVKVISIKDI